MIRYRTADWLIKIDLPSYKETSVRGAAIAPWFPTTCGPGFESQAHHLRLFQFVLLKLWWENNGNKQKEAGIGPFFKKNIHNLNKLDYLDR